MRDKENDAYYKRGRVILGILIIGLLCLSVYLQRKQHSENYRLVLYDRSGEEHIESDSAEERKEEQIEEQTEKQADEIYSVPMQTIRVLLYQTGYTSIYHENLVIGIKGQENVIEPEPLEDDFHNLQASLQEQGILLDTYSADTRAYCLEMADGSMMEVLSIERSCGYPVYRGRLILYPENGKFIIVNELSVEEYLYSVLPSEMPASFDMEALKAQAVCARTYASHFFYQEKYPQYHAHLDDSTACQVYGNQSEHAQTSKAVDETRGMILWNESLPAETFYYSTSCGLSADISVWPDYDISAFPYLKAHTLNEKHEEVDFSDDPSGIRFYDYLMNAQNDYEKELPWYRWFGTVDELDVSLILKKMQERYQVKPSQIQKYENGKMVSEAPGNFDEILQLSITKRNKGGSVLEVCILTAEAEYRISGEYNIRYILCDNRTEIVKRDGSKYTMTSILPSSFFVLTPILDKERVIGYSVSGGGYGHGVGMSQNGANILAHSGRDYSEILEYYYPGTKLLVNP